MSPQLDSQQRNRWASSGEGTRLSPRTLVTGSSAWHAAFSVGCQHAALKPTTLSPHFFRTPWKEPASHMI